MKPKNNKQVKEDDLMDFLMEEEENEPATRVSFELDPTTGKITNESEPGLEKEYVDGLKSKQKEVEIDIETEGEEEETPDVEIKESSDEDEAQPPSKTKSVEEDDSEEAVKKNELDRKRKSRSQERIRQLAKEKREALLKAAKLEETLNKTNAIYAKIQIDSLEKGIDGIKKKLQAAVENQDAEAIAEANSEYLEAYSQLKEYKQFLPNAEKASEESTSRIENFDKEYKEVPNEDAADMEYPEAAQMWMEGKEFIWDAKEYKKLPMSQRKQIYPIRAEVQRVLETLVKNEGYSPDDEELYEELDLRVSSKFPEYEGIASKGLSALNSSNKAVKAPSGETSDSKKPRNVEEKTRSVPVKGPSSVGSQEPSGPKSTKVKLSREDFKYWENYLQPRGVTLQEYAKEIKAFENNQ